MKRYGIIYKVTNNINGKIYIGLTTLTANHRWIEHKSVKVAYLLHSAIKKYGQDNFKMEEIYTSFNKEDLCEKEQYFIQYHNSISPNGYNLTTGGEHFKHNDATKKLISEKCKGREAPNKGKEMPLEQRQHLSRIKTGSKHSDETRARMSAAKKGKPPNNKGKKLSIETRALMSLSRQGKVLSEETKLKLSAAQENRKAILCLNNNKEYLSITQASNDLGISRKIIRKILTDSNYASLYQFKYLNP